MTTVIGRPESLTDTHFSFCPGCTHGIIMRLIAEVVDELGIINDTIGVSPVGCSGFCQDYFDFDFIGPAHGRAQAAATGIKRAMPNKIIFSYQGDGDIAAIGTQHAIHTAARGEHITSIMVNNAIYGMTGGQMAPTTLLGMKSSTTPYGRSAELAGYPIDLPKIISGLEAPVYVASMSVDSPKNIMATKKALLKAFRIQQLGLGFSFISILSTCPTNWGLSPVDSLKWLQDNMIPAYSMGELKVAKEVEHL